VADYINFGDVLIRIQSLHDFIERKRGGRGEVCFASFESGAGFYEYFGEYRT
jgi:hypothetical protein